MCNRLGYVCVVFYLLPYALSYLIWVDECCSVSLLVIVLLPLNLPYSPRRYIYYTRPASIAISSLAKYVPEFVPWYLLSPFPLSLLLPPSCRQPMARLWQVQDDDVSKVTLPAWPGQGYGRHWLSSGLLVQFVSCPYSDVFDLLYDLELCLVYLYLDSLESLLYICILWALL